MSDRREFLRQSGGVLLMGSLMGVGLLANEALGSKSRSEGKGVLRPPMAVSEKAFMDLCLKCGQCLQVCPYNSILLFDDNHGYLGGTPYINPYFRGCYLCTLLPCVLACPSGALNDHFSSVDEVNMGKAVVVKLSSCLGVLGQNLEKKDILDMYKASKFITKGERQSGVLQPLPNPSKKREIETKLLQKVESFVGKPCSLCAGICPLPNSINAIEMREYKGGLRPVIKEGCVGCAACVEACPKDVFELIPAKRGGENE